MYSPLDVGQSLTSINMCGIASEVNFLQTIFIKKSAENIFDINIDYNAYFHHVKKNLMFPTI